MTIVVIALSKILDDLGGETYLAWVLSSYMLTSAAANSLIGRFSDLYGRRPMYLFSLGTTNYY